MKINVTLPFDHIEQPDEFLTPEAVVEVAQLAEKLGFAGGNVTDHPCPTGRWLDGGGHYAQDPFVMLTLVAAATTTFRLQTGILVLPYRNPFITARAVATLDLYSRGRVTLGLGAGYLKGEYKALGVDFERRNEIMDDYLIALKKALSGEEFTHNGDGYEAPGNRIRPGPVQKPHPPLLVGGNSKRAIRRAAELADGWNPFFTPAQLSSTARTAAMTGEEDLAGGLAYLREHCEKIGRTTAPVIQLASINSGDERSPGELIEKIGQFGEMGVSGCAVNVNGTTRAEWCDNARRFADDVLKKIDVN
ncbi:MAG TPA: TIGR03619 family F420-dependent LLM class oxidoreductase [Solimonas sp.]|nr:TIGR03619 family F420-dependent LLM class oxidoreductase [Solimonas sp.]